MPQITHKADETGRLVQVVTPAQLRLQLDIDGDNDTRPEYFGPDDEWQVGPATPKPSNELLAFLSVQQPWAHVIATGEKTIECRTYQSKHRGQLVICAGKTPRNPWPAHIANNRRWTYGATVCVCQLVDCRPLVQADVEAAGLAPDTIIQPGNWAWILEGVKPLEAVPVSGKVFLWKERNRAVSEAVSRAMR